MTDFERRAAEIERPPPVLSKADFAVRYAKGEFGNASPTYRTCEELLRVGERYPGAMPVPGKYHLRSKVPGGPTEYNLSWSAAVARWCDKPNPGGWYCSAMAPEDRKILQGEILLMDASLGLSSGLYLNYNTKRLPMREGMALESKHAEGPRARLILMHALCPNSLDWLGVLLDRYPLHAVEFSTYECNWGTLEGFNTVWWEVRKY